MAKKKRQLLLRYPTFLDVWQLGSAEKTSGENQLTANALLKLSKEPVKLLQLRAKDDEWIVCSAISPNGDCLAYSTDSGFYVYNFIQSDGVNLKLVKLTVPEEVEPSIHRMMFLSKGKKLLLANAKLEVQLLDLDGGRVELVHTFEDFKAEDSIHLMDTSLDASFAALADHKSSITILDMKSMKIHATLPRYKSHPTALAFHPNSKLLVVAYADHKVFKLNSSLFLKKMFIISFYLRNRL